MTCANCLMIKESFSRAKDVCLCAVLGVHMAALLARDFESLSEATSIMSALFLIGAGVFFAKYKPEL